jgi:PKD repeat protein
MKKDIRLLWVLLLLCLQTTAFANIVIVKGTIKDSNNVYLSNKLVKIYSTDTSNGGCLISHNVYTNPNGFYIDTLKCTGGDIRKLYIIVENCNGAKITRDPAVNSTGVMEVNFIICANQNIPPPKPTNCKAYFSSTITDSIVKFNSSESVASTSPGIAPDSIISRTWYFLSNYPNTATLTGNRVDPSYTYTKPGTYQVYLVIKTKYGCESKFTATVTIKAPAAPTTCKSFFTKTISDGLVKFNSADAKAANEKDSIISRYWLFGETTSSVGVLQGNIIDPSHTYAKPGKYIAILYIKTTSGCESRFADTFNIANVICKAKADFTAEKIKLKKVLFNSSNSIAQTGDSIIQRTWKFGDNTSLLGNAIQVEREYPSQGIYTACLLIKTLNGCVADTCKKVVVQDTINIPPTTTDFIKILAINPNPVIYNFRATIYSSTKDIETEINVYDIYGVLKSSMKMVLAKGNNIVEVQTANLHHGPYFLRVVSKSGKDSKIFYKL